MPSSWCIQSHITMCWKSNSWGVYFTPFTKSMLGIFSYSSFSSSFRIRGGLLFSSFRYFVVVVDAVVRMILHEMSLYFFSSNFRVICQSTVWRIMELRMLAQMWNVLLNIVHLICLMLVSIPFHKSNAQFMTAAFLPSLFFSCFVCDGFFFLFSSFSAVWVFATDHTNWTCTLLFKCSLH